MIRAGFAPLLIVLTAVTASAETPTRTLTPLTAAQQASAKTYRAAMKRGRVATDKKDYPAAIAAFTDALAAKKDDPEALAERGYASYLAKKYDAAGADLALAQKGAVGSSQQGMIWFNLGLLAEARGDAAAATHAFAESNRIRPSKAAAKKLAGKNVCAATVNRTRTAGTTYAGWAAAAKGLATAAAIGDLDPDDAPPAKDAEARAWLCGDDGCPDAGPWIVATHDSVGDEGYHLLIAKGTKLVAFENLGGKLAGRCESVDVVEIVGGAPLQVHVTQEPNDMVEVDSSSGDLRECKSDHCSQACFYTEKVDLDLFYDVGAGAQVLAIIRPFTPATKSEYKLDEDFAQKVSLARGKDGVALKGGGCDQQVPFATK